MRNCMIVFPILVFHERNCKSILLKHMDTAIRYWIMHVGSYVNMLMMCPLIQTIVEYRGCTNFIAICSCTRGPLKNEYDVLIIGVEMQHEYTELEKASMERQQ